MCVVRNGQQRMMSHKFIRQRRPTPAGAAPHPCASTKSRYQRWCQLVRLVLLAGAGGGGSALAVGTQRELDREEVCERRRRAMLSYPAVREGKILLIPGLFAQ